MTIQAKDFSNREDLNNHIKSEIGDNLILNRQEGHLIEGTKEELEALFLDKYSNIYGCKVKVIEKV